MPRPPASRRHRTITDTIPAEFEGKPVHIHVPTLTLAAFRQAYPSGRIRCGSCGELVLQGDMSVLVRKWGADAIIRIALSHDFFPDEPSPQDHTPVEERRSPAQCPVLFADGAREKYVLNGDGCAEWLYGVVYRDARSPERVYREIWYPTGVFCASEGVPDAQA